MNKTACNFLLFIILLVLAVLFFGCEKPKELNRRVPKKPFYVTGVESTYGGDYRVFYIDADSSHFSFEIDWLDHGTYKPGDIIK